ncbi:hypothetical protein [Polyangium sp. 15x6]|uniref:hypothetical protein n=1 Tax=Polyangium sp. 15x6 TaxID=3042687 RepID=UPI00249C3535|nr:hypothetical protein [Polyangium sp. 15x6]MDI3290836.1 hypothetical protein [Polyangium sp. 15x6]
MKGQPSQITLVSSADGVSFDPPKTCRGQYPDSPQYYIRVHGHGKRRIEYTQRKPNECDKPDAKACPNVHFMSFGMSTLGALRAELGKDNASSVGAGACGETSGPIERWNVSNQVHDFRHVDEALRIMDAELRRWNIGDDWGLTLAGIECAFLE